MSANGKTAIDRAGIETAESIDAALWPNGRKANQPTAMTVTSSRKDGNHHRANGGANDPGGASSLLLIDGVFADALIQQDAPPRPLCTGRRATRPNKTC